MRATLTISAGNRNYTVQGEPSEVDKLFDRLVQATFVPVNQPMFIPPIMGCDMSDGHDMTAKVPVPSRAQEEVKSFEKDKVKPVTVEEEVKPSEPAPKKEESKEEPKKEYCTEPNGAVPEEPSEPEHTEEPSSNEPRKYRGFLVVKCQHCGHTKGFLARQEISNYKCDCGGITPLGDLVPLTALCECGKRWRYMTNMTDDSFEINCIHCGSPIPVFWNDKKHKYETMFENLPGNKSKKNKKGK